MTPVPDLRSLLVSIAYRMVGSRSDAEDLAQEALLRVHLAGQRADIASVEAYATTVVTRLALDHLRSARVRREAYVGPWLPEPVSTDPHADGAHAAELGDSLALAFLVALEALGPVERAALLLHDVFGYGYDELSTMLERSEAACRQQVSRARAHLRATRPRFTVDPDHHRRLLDRFRDACAGGDVAGLVALLSDDAVLLTDGGPHRRAARHPVVGARRVAAFLAKVLPRGAAAGALRVADVNGAPGLVLVDADGVVRSAGAVDLDEAGRIRAFHWVVNPDKLGWISPG